VRELVESLEESRRIMFDREKDRQKDVKTRERWTQIHNSTSQILNNVLRDLQMKDWEKRLKIVEEYRRQQRTVSINQQNPDDRTAEPLKALSD
jgi:FixJ family two-component response regulator